MNFELPTVKIKSTRQERNEFLLVALSAGAVGAMAAYLLDPQQGRGRRALWGDVLAARSRRLARGAGRRARWAASTGVGMLSRLRAPDARETLDEAELAHKVESVLFRDPEVPKGRININAEHDVVFLRGNLDDPEQIDEIVRRVESIDGVRSVVNLLHPSPIPAAT